MIQQYSPPPDASSAYSMLSVLRILLDKIARTDPRSGDQSVHATRKAMKRARAVLRLMRAEIGDSAYRRANRQLRDAARPLRSVRDTAVLLTALTKLVKPSDESAFKAYVDRLHRRVRQMHDSAYKQLTHEAFHLNASAVQSLNRRTARMPVGLAEPLSARRGLKKTYKSGRHAFDSARRNPSIVSLHECRKQAKYLANELEVAQELLHPPLKKTRRRASRVAAALGDDHDLALLSSKLHQWEAVRRPGAPSPQVERLEHRIKTRRRRLQAKAWRIGKKLYGAPPRKFDTTVKNHMS